MSMIHMQSDERLSKIETAKKCKQIYSENYGRNQFSTVTQMLNYTMQCTSQEFTLLTFLFSMD
ncbi:CLUMA_CG015001, isoform A [Clunio marinus]|uniref:CLUMA_CG015001, isoform A n=1 Tax=Clunio marinus TaxID=568069 RepID=A0A1J1ITF0_9DIPT|nr:CLUMA_CG015001, isoform A [Clunio marinus]